MEQKLLTVEPFRLMHTGNFYEFFLQGWKNIGQTDVAYFGISTIDFPEANCSIYAYVNDENRNTQVIHHESEHEATAVYRKGYLKKLKLTKRKILDTNLEEIIRKFKGQSIPFDYFGEQGLKVQAKDIYDTSQIEAIICYNSRDLELYKIVMTNRSNYLLLYLEVDNPQFLELYNRSFRIVKPKDESDSKEREIKRTRLSLERIGKTLTQRRIPITEDYKEKAAVALARVTRGIGIPRYNYVLRT